MTNPNDPDAIRRDIERTQTALSNDVDSLTEKVSPNRIVERRVERVRGRVQGWKDSVMGSDADTGYTPGYSGGPADAAQRAAGTISDTASSTGNAVSGMASDAAGAVQEAPQAIRRQARGNPLAAGIIAFGAGWLISSLVPASRREQELAEQAKDKATELGGPVAKQAATEFKDNLTEPAQQAVESVKSTATDAGQTVVEEGRSAAGQVQGDAQDAAAHVQRSASSD